MPPLGVIFRRHRGFVQILMQAFEPCLKIAQNIKWHKKMGFVMPLTMRDQVIEACANGQDGGKFLIYV